MEIKMDLIIILCQGGYQPGRNDLTAWDLPWWWIPLCIAVYFIITKIIPGRKD